jgi:alkylation response protein AidB-like acyl-CoA dehydrogenase
MEFGPSEEQMLLKESISRYLVDNGALERIHDFADEGEARAEDIWAGLCNLGLPGLLVDEKHGGVGLDLIDAALVSETLGHHVAPVPFVSTMVMVPLAIASAGSEAQQSRWLPALADGSLIVGAAMTEAVHSRHDARIEWDGAALNGKSLFVLDFEADLYLVADTNRALYMVEANAPGLERRLLNTIDKTRRVGELVFDNVVHEHYRCSADHTRRRHPGCGTEYVESGRRILIAARTIRPRHRLFSSGEAYVRGNGSGAGALSRHGLVRCLCLRRHPR